MTKTTHRQRQMREGAKFLAREFLRQRHQDAMSYALTAAELDEAIEAAVADGFTYDDFTGDVDGFRFDD